MGPGEISAQLTEQLKHFEYLKTQNKKHLILYNELFLISFEILLVDKG